MIKIEVNTVKGYPVLLNVDYISSIQPGKKGGAVIKMEYFETYIATESYNEIVERIKQAESESIFPELGKPSAKKAYKIPALTVYQQVE